MTVFARLAALFERLFEPRVRRAGLPRLGYDGPSANAVASAAVPAVDPQISNDQSDVMAALPPRARIYEAFDVSVPVVERSGLAGRAADLNRLFENVFDQQKHAVVFGARGSGKTSLTRVFGDIADEAGATVLYDIVSGDSTFSDLMRPVLAEMRDSGLLREADVAEFNREDFDARRVAALFTHRVNNFTVLILDEFDQIRSADTKRELATLMKLLSDMRTLVRIVTVGIAADLAELITGHPSLRRHVAAVPVGAISSAYLVDLLNRCAARAGMRISTKARSDIVEAAMGSPYHLRLFGLNAALEAHEAAQPLIETSHSSQGFNRAFTDWYQMDPRGPLVISRLASASLPVRENALSVVYHAATQNAFDEDMIVRKRMEHGASEKEARALAHEVMFVLDPIFTPFGDNERRSISDTLAPHFLLLMECGKIPHPTSALGGGSQSINETVSTERTHP